MGKSVFIAEKPSVAREFAKALKYNMKSRDGYMESEEAIVTWCVGHLVTMSYPEAYDEKYRRWSLQTIPFIPEHFKYEVIDSVKKQFQIVSGLLNRSDVDTIYVCTDSGREGEYIYRLVEQQAGVHGKMRKRVWIDSQTEEEILRGIREARDLSAYDNLSNAAYLRAKEDYLMGINFSRVLTLKYSSPIKSYLKADKAVVSVGRVMTCVLGMVVNREREIRDFVKIPFYRVLAQVEVQGRACSCEWKAVEGSKYYQSPLLYKDNGFLEEKDADAFIGYLQEEPVGVPVVEKLEKKKETRNPPLLYNLAELQNDCSKLFKISPDETLRIAQELYEKKMTTYPRTDARVLSTAVAKEIHKNIGGLRGYGMAAPFAEEILSGGSYKNIGRTRYVNDKQITDHYAIIPTGQGLGNLNGLHPTSARVYEIIVRRFLSIFYPAAVYQKVSIGVKMKGELFSTSFKVLAEPGYLKVSQYSFSRKKADEEGDEKKEEKEEQETACDASFMENLKALKKGTQLPLQGLEKKEGETSPPKRYNSGTMILTMENAGQFIEDEELRAQIKGSGIGTSATRAEILKKLVNIKYLALNKKTQIITPTLLGEMIYEVVDGSIKPLLDPRLTASWEKGLTLVADGQISEQEYMGKLDDFVSRRTNVVKQMNNQSMLYHRFQYVEQFYKK
ncbi:MAG: type IA DNA topoisomerase [Lachnospiraceae bacterium]|nr:type IA DNA topoisomerase [Lachnospiraceae bacterium]MCI9254302.1 type IA DNA topoisomerase [Lachnospiraceae bacterium]